MVERGDTITFRSRNDRQILRGTIREVFTSEQVRQTFGGNVMIVDTPDRGRGWEIISDADVQD